jgi:hypothetical protein
MTLPTRRGTALSDRKPGTRAAKPRIPVRSEHDEQVYLFEWAQITRRRRPELEWLHAVPNGGMRSKAVAGKLRAEGVKAGVVDLFLDVARDGELRRHEVGVTMWVRPKFHGLRIEMKAQGRASEKDGGCSQEQVKWIRHYLAEGYAVAVCYGWRDAADVIERYLDGKHENRLPLFAE